jgi:multidrug efflux pump subunit AcrA (membrane-fusion protein)
MVVVLLALIGGAVALARSGSTAPADDQIRTVTVQSVSSLGGGSDSVSIVGNVRSVTQADLLAQAGGTVEAVHAHIGSVVPAGYVVAELDNATERAQVLQAQGAYDAAVAAGCGDRRAQCLSLCDLCARFHPYDASRPVLRTANPVRPAVPHKADA